LLLAAPIRSLILQSLLPRLFISARRAKRRTPDPAQLLCFRQQIGIDGESDVSHVLEPPNGLVNLFDDKGLGLQSCVGQCITHARNDAKCPSNLKRV
jgi:hypothetical protein